MELNEILQDLNRQFAAPLPEFYDRRIIVWYDEEGEFSDVVGQLELAEAKVAVLNGRNQFAVKKLLGVDDRYSNYLLYCPLRYEVLEDDWLLDVKLYSQSFHADRISMWMEELRIPHMPALRKAVKEYRDFFNAKERRSKVQKQKITEPRQLHLAVMAVICGIKDAAPAAVLRAVLQAGMGEENGVLARMRQYAAEERFWQLVREGTGYDEKERRPNRLAAHILLTAAARTMRPELLAGLERYISTPHQAFCYDFIASWLRGEDSASLFDIARYVEAEMRLSARFGALALEDLLDTECFPCLNTIILKKLMADIANRVMDPDAVVKAVDKRRTCAWYDEVKNFYEGILQAANMQRFYKEHAGGFHTVEPAQMWKDYTETYYRMDTYYRLFHLAYGSCLKSYHADLHDEMGLVKDQVEGLYGTWFLGQLGGKWTDICADQLREYGYLLDIERQEDFYARHVQTADTKLFVIISDALRYEVASSLAEKLRRETQSQVTLGSCQGIFPTITKFGMAALLPHQELSAEDKGDRIAVLVDGGSSESGARDKVLKKANPSNVALKYGDIIGLSRGERSALVRDKRVVYIYHDTIDTASHTADSMVFPACDAAVGELKDMVRIIVNDFGSTNIIITADHGFLYTYSPLTESDKVGKQSFAGMDKEYGRRYAILEKGAVPEYLLPVRFLGGRTDYDAFTPRENIRIKMNGGGLNFVHGGISLQEMVVPIIEYHYLRNDSREYQRNKARYDTKPVSVVLLTANKRLSNLMVNLDFYQKEPVGGNRESCNYLLYFMDAAGKKISDEQRIIADKTGTESMERTFRLPFTLKSQKYSGSDSYYLVIADESGLQPPQRIEFEIKIAMALR